jgi:multisubunit Na+/H+ antiporter MnhF subunit
MIIVIAYNLFLFLVGASIACSLYRLWHGPTVADRINAADVIALCCVGLALGHGWKNGEELWLDVAMVASLVLFVGTTALSIFISSESLSEQDE